MAVTVDDMTLDDVRAHLAAALPSDAAFDGWTMTALDERPRVLAWMLMSRASPFLRAPAR